MFNSFIYHPGLLQLTSGRRKHIARIRTQIFVVTLLTSINTKDM
jgi:hypothetical protein